MKRQPPVVWLLTCWVTACGAPAPAQPLEIHPEPARRGEADAGVGDDGPSSSEAPDTASAPGEGGELMRPPNIELSEMGPDEPELPSGPCGTYEHGTGLYPPERESYLQFAHDGLEREFKVFIPSNYDNETPLPLVYGFHGLTGNAESVMLDGTDMDAKAEESGFILVLPNGYNVSWNTGDCCGDAAKEGVDDVGYLREVHQRLRRDLGLCFDSSRVYATGYSNGGFMMYRLACEASDLFAAVASVAGTMTLDADECEASRERPVPLLEVHGTNDVIIAPLTSPKPGRGTNASVQTIARLNGCEPDTVAAAIPEASGDTECETHPDCDEGVEVTMCLSKQGGHCWFGSPTCGTGSPLTGLFASNATGIDANVAVWSFLSRFRCETCGQ